MPQLLSILLGAAGGVLLYYGADFLVSGGVGIAGKLRVPRLIIGLTVVAFGTSAPELTVSVEAALRGEGDIAVGNIIGSNICNIALILGLCSVVYPLSVNKQVLKSDLPVMVLATSVLIALLHFAGGIPRWGGAVFLLMMAAYLAFLFVSAKKNRMTFADEIEEDNSKTLLRSAAEFCGGLIALILGARLFVSGAVAAAVLLKVPSSVIALTVVAIGTSLPELAASLAAVLKKQNDIAVGNIVGSNIWNILCITGISPLVKPMIPEKISSFDLAVLAGMTLSAALFLNTGRRVSRIEGALWLISYAAYIWYLIP